MTGLAKIDAMIKALREFKAEAPKLAIDAVEENKHVLIDMVFEEQLFLEGVNRHNVPIMDYQPYSPSTIWYKRQKGQPSDRVTLRDEGDFHAGGDTERHGDLAIEVISTDPKSEDLQRKYGTQILYPKPDNMDELREHYVKPYMRNKLRKKLLG